MNLDCDTEDFERINQMLRKFIDGYERQARMKPLMDAMQTSISHMMSVTVPEVMAAPTAQTRTATLNLEKTNAEFGAKLKAAEERMGGVLSGAKQRTDALRQWLEAIS